MAAPIDTSVWFQPRIGDRLKPSMRHVYTTWAGFQDKVDDSSDEDEDDLSAHLHSIRKRAWPLGEYPCIGLWMFLLPGLAAFPQFPAIVARARQDGAVIVDLGVGLGQELRSLAAHGVPTDRMWALDVERGLWHLGFDLFRDRGRMKARFIEGDFLARDAASSSSSDGSEDGNASSCSSVDEQLEQLHGSVDLVLANQFLHLFSWDGQIAATKRIVALSKPGTMLVGYQQGRKTARQYIRPWGMMFYHNVDSFRLMWDEIQRDTGTTWAIDVCQVDLKEWGMKEEDMQWMPADRQGINFVITRLS